MAEVSSSSQLDKYIDALNQEHPATASSHHPQYVSLAQEIRHNLEFQHRWTHLQTHFVSPTGQELSRPVVSGLPPRRLYVHPDEQIELVKLEGEYRKKKEQRTLDDATIEPEFIPKPELEWVFPTQLEEEWTLRRLASVFDSIPIIPPPRDGFSQPDNKWRTMKKALIAILQDDSTVVYYVVHDGTIKPRQN